MLDKSVGIELVDRLASTLVDHWANPAADMQVHIGPVAAEAARLWIENTRHIVAAVIKHPEVLTTPLARPILDQFEDYTLSGWDDLSRTTNSFFWSARAKPSDVDDLLQAWAVMDAMTDEQLTRLGVQWSGPEATPFYEALTRGILEAVDAHATSQELAKVLRRPWDPPA